MERKKGEPDPDVDTLLNDVSTLEAIGIDVSFVDEIRRQRRGEMEDGPDARLARSGRAIAGLWTQQNQRLSTQPALSLIRAPSPSSLETRLAENVANQLTEQVRISLEKKSSDRGLRYSERSRDGAHSARRDECLGSRPRHVHHLRVLR